VGWDASDRRLVDQAAHVASSFGASCQEVDRDGSPEFFTALSARITQGLYMPDDAWVDPDQAVDILLRALEVLDVTVVTEKVQLVSGDAAGVQAITATAALAPPRASSPPARSACRAARSRPGLTSCVRCTV